MRPTRIVAICLAAMLCASALPIVGSDQAAGSTAFMKVSVQAVDSSAHTLTFRTVTGETWTLPAASPDLLKDLQAGDICSLEIDSEDRVVKVVKAGSP